MSKIVHFNEWKQWLKSGSDDNAPKTESRDDKGTRSGSIPRILVLDGGSTYLLERLLPTIDNHESIYDRNLWSSSLLMSEQGRTLIKKAHCDFLQAGCDVVSSVTYQCNYNARSKLKDNDIDRMLKDGVRLAREAVDEFHLREHRVAFVVATIGCYGASLADGSEYTGNYGLQEKDIYDFHRRKLMVLADSSPDWIAFETIPCEMECHAIVKLLKTLNVKNLLKCPIWISFACCDDKHLNDGTLLSNALDTLYFEDPEAKCVSAIGINCCSAVTMKKIVTSIITHNVFKLSSRAVVFYPNLGEEWDAANECWKSKSGSDVESLANSVMETIKLVRKDSHKNVPMIVGGCCRTEPWHTKCIQSLIRHSGYR